MELAPETEEARCQIGLMDLSSPAILLGPKGQRWARMMLFVVNGENCEMFELPCELMSVPPGFCASQPETHRHYALLGPAVIGSAN